ncbi:MAG: hypothetical protein O2888_04610 [Chloroflexi bacterium]|nr:hypothetical protein [Chloroflexota bacterium]
MPTGPTPDKVHRLVLDTPEMRGHAPVQIEKSHPNCAESTAAPAIVDALLYSVSHDLRSPLLTMTLSADLIEDGLSALGEQAALPQTTVLGLDAIRRGAADLERMLEALTVLSRARRQVLSPARSPLALVLSGYRVSGDSTTIAASAVAVDALELREFIDAVTGDDDATVDVGFHRHQVELTVCTDVEALADAPPLAVLVGSLHQFAGGSVQDLAARQALLERRGCHFSAAAGRITVGVPLEAAT